MTLWRAEVLGRGRGDRHSKRLPVRSREPRGGGGERERERDREKEREREKE